MSAEPPSSSGDVPRLPMNGICVRDADYGNFSLKIPSMIPIMIHLQFSNTDGSWQPFL